jgi:hypothetical protein
VRTPIIVARRRKPGVSDARRKELRSNKEGEEDGRVAALALRSARGRQGGRRRVVVGWKMGEKEVGDWGNIKGGCGAALANGDADGAPLLGPLSLFLSSCDPLGFSAAALLRSCVNK